MRKRFHVRIVGTSWPPPSGSFECEAELVDRASLDESRERQQVAELIRERIGPFDFWGQIEWGEVHSLDRPVFYRQEKLDIEPQPRSRIRDHLLSR